MRRGCPPPIYFLFNPTVGGAVPLLVVSSFNALTRRGTAPPPSLSFQHHNGRDCPPPCCLLKCNDEEGLSPSSLFMVSTRQRGGAVPLLVHFLFTTTGGAVPLPSPCCLRFQHADEEGLSPPCCLQHDEEERLFPSLFTFFFSSSQQEGCPPSLFFMISMRRGGHVPLLIYFLFNMMAGRGQSLQCNMEVNIHFLKVFASLLCHC